MKRTLVLCCLVLAAASMASAQVNISASAHNFSAQAWSDNKICAPCHIPHSQMPTVAPLWSHDLTTGGAGYTLYGSGTPSPGSDLDATMESPLAAGHEPTRLCLSCHDDTVTLSAFDGNDSGTAGTINTHYPGSLAVLGLDLTGDHPVAFSYTTAVATADGELADPATVAAARDLLYNLVATGGTMECGSCHDPHNGADADGLLRVTDAGSALCLRCHTK